MERKHILVIGAVFTVLLSLYLFTSVKSAKISDVRLVLFVTVDQLADEYVSRYEPHFRGGLKYLLHNGAVFRNVHHTHSNTATCPGHASITTGALPASHGIVGNWWYDRARQKRTYCVGEDLSPTLLRRSGIPDWLQERYPNGKVFSVSGKDRAAIIMGGMNPDGVYWYDRSSGKMSSSSHYTNRGLPWWIDVFNEEHASSKYFGHTWYPKFEEYVDPSSLGNLDFDFGDFPDHFPHSLGGVKTAPHGGFHGAIFHSPFLDAITLDFSRQLITHHELGRDDDMDYLSISLSALDSVGHRYGPHSRETMDTLLRLDEILGTFFSTIDAEVGLEHVLIVLTSDHGIDDFPEYRSLGGKEGARVSPADIACVQNASLSDLYTGGVFESPSYFKSQYLNDSGEPKKKVLQEVKKRLLRCNPVAAVWSAGELTWPIPEDTYLQKMQKRFANNYYPERSPDLFILYKPHYSLMSRHGINHGSPHEYDSSVPVVFLNKQIAPIITSDTTFRSVTDIAPTVSELLGFSPREKINGKDLKIPIL